MVEPDNAIDIDARRVRQRPSPGRLARLDKLRAGESEHEAYDAVAGAAARAPTAELLRLQVIELSREAAALHWDRLHASDARERQRLSSRRIRALRAVSAAVVELHRLEGGEPSPRIVDNVLRNLQELVEGTVVELFDVEAAERMLATLRARLGPALARIAASGGA